MKLINDIDISKQAFAFPLNALLAEKITDNADYAILRVNEEPLHCSKYNNKDKIDVCKDCEYRYACLDCRCFRMNEDIYSKPKKCKYNPYE